MGFSIIFALCSIFLSSYFLHIYSPKHEIIFFTTPITSTVSTEEINKHEVFYKTSLFRKVHYGGQQIPKFLVHHNIEKSILSNEYKLMLDEDLAKEKLDNLIPIYCNKDIIFVIKNLNKLKKYNISKMELCNNYQWRVELIHKSKKVVVIFPFGNINISYLDKLQKYYSALDNFSYIEILGEHSIIASK